MRDSVWLCDVCVNQFAENNRKNGRMVTVSCTTTMCPHTSHLVQQFLAKHGTAQLQQPPYSPDLAPCDFFLFPRLKKVLKGHRFDEATMRHPERGVNKMFPTVAATLGEACSCGRELCWRKLGLKPRKRYLLHVLWSVRILFEQTSYMYLKNCKITPKLQCMQYCLPKTKIRIKEKWRIYSRTTSIMSENSAYLILNYCRCNGMIWYIC